MFLTTKAILLGMRAKLTTPEQWTQRRYARLKDGSPASYSNKHACSYCMSGAILSIAEDEPKIGRAHV